MSSVSAVAANEYTSAAAVGLAPAATSGATYPAVPARRRSSVGVDDSPKSTSDDPAGGGEDQVRRLDVSVHDGRVVSVKVLERLGGLLEVVDRERRVEPGRPSASSNASRSMPSIQSIAMT